MMLTDASLLIQSSLFIKSPNHKADSIDEDKIPEQNSGHLENFINVKNLHQLLTVGIIFYPINQDL